MDKNNKMIGEIVDNLRYQMYDLITSPRFWYILIFIILLIALVRYLYIAHVVVPNNKKYRANKEYIEDDSKGEATLYIFYTTWCPYCKDALETIDEFKVTTKSVNGVTINYTEVDAEENEGLANKYNVESYPTLVLDYQGKRVLFDSNVKPELLKKFLYTSLA